MKHTSQVFNFWTLNLLFITSIHGIVACSESGSGDEISDQVLDSDFAYTQWPNDSTSDSSSSEITSKVLVTDLDNQGGVENVFISVLPNSSDKRSSILRVTNGEDFTELANYKSNRISLLQDSIPFPYDLNKDGFKELLFVSYDRDEVFAFEFKDNLKNVFVRWSVDLPEPLELDFDRHLREVVYGKDKVVQVGQFGLLEKQRHKVKVVDLTKQPSTGDDDDDDD